MIKEQPRQIFVFGSNLAGRHGAGSALYARQKHGAIYGVGVGIQGNSYAIPTKNRYLKPLTLKEIGEYVQEFKTFATENPQLVFKVSAVGTGLAGYSPEDIAPLFEGCPYNCVLPNSFEGVV